MNKIKTIFNRDWRGDRGLINSYVEEGLGKELVKLSATEKLDGTNVRLTIRNHRFVRLEKRKNPAKIQKANGVVEPWYVDAREDDPADRFIFKAANNTDFRGIPDGEHSAEAVGPKIQGNPLNLAIHKVFLFGFSIPAFENAPVTFEGLKEWLPKQKSKVGNDCGIEGLVWSWGEPLFKIKVKDFK